MPLWQKYVYVYVYVYRVKPRVCVAGKKRFANDFVQIGSRGSS